MKNVIVTGSCETEIQGVLSLLNECGIRAFQWDGEKPLDSNDLLIVAMSAEPLLGWGKHLSSLLAMKLQWRCTMVVLVPNEVAPIRLLDVVGCIVPGGYSMGWTRNVLLHLIRKWQNCKPLPIGNIRRSVVVKTLDSESVSLFFAQMKFLVSKVPIRLNKTEYGCRGRIFGNMGFCHLLQVKLFMSGAPKNIGLLLLVCL